MKILIESLLKLKKNMVTLLLKVYLRNSKDMTSPAKMANLPINSKPSLSKVKLIKSNTPLMQVMNVSQVLKCSSILNSLILNGELPSTKVLIMLFRDLLLIPEDIFMQILFCLVVQLCLTDLHKDYKPLSKQEQTIDCKNMQLEIESLNPQKSMLPKILTNVTLFGRVAVSSQLSLVSKMYVRAEKIISNMVLQLLDKMQFYHQECDQRIWQHPINILKSFNK